MIEEKRKLRNSRQRHKRQQRATERKALEEVKLQKVREDHLKEVEKLRETANVYCRKCEENKRFRELYGRNTHRPEVSILFCLGNTIREVISTTK